MDKLAHKIDANGYMLEPVLVDDSFVNTADTIVDRCPDGFYKPQWTGTQWVDAGAKTTSQLLAESQQSAIDQLGTLRDNDIFSTFQSSCTGTLYTYTADDRARARYSYMATKAYNDTTYTGESIYTHEASFVQHTSQQIIQLVNDEAQHERDMWTKYEQFVQQVRGTTTPEDALAVVSKWKG